MPSASTNTEIVVQKQTVGGREIPVVTSRQIAAKFGKLHKNVIKAIKAQPNDEFGRLNFEPGSYIDEQGQERPEYLVTEQGFVLLAMGFTGKEAREWKIRFIEAFDRAREAVATLPTPRYPAEMGTALLEAGIRISEAERRYESMLESFADLECANERLIEDNQRVNGLLDSWTKCMHLWNRLVRGTGTVGFRHGCALLGSDEGTVSGHLVAMGVCARHPRTRRLTVCNPPAVHGVAEPAVYTGDDGRPSEGVRLTGYGLCTLSVRMGAA